MSDELWYVKLANGDVHRVTLDQLDGAFQAGHIDESTMVLAAGASVWSKLGDLAGLDDEAAAAAPQTSHAAPAAPHYEYAAPQTQYVAPAPQAPYAAPAPQAQAPQAHYVAPRQAQYVAPVPARSPAYAAPVQAAAYVAPRAVAVPAAAPTYAANSLRPMSMDLGDAADYDMPFPRRSRKGWVAAVVGLAAVAGGVAFAANSGHFSFGHLNLNFGGGGSDDLATVAAAAAMAAPPPAVDPVVTEPAAATPPQVAPAATTNAPSPSTGQTEGSPLNPQFTTRANEDAQQKLAASDKTHGAKSKARHSGGGAAHASSKPKSSTFTTGGNKYDPMNSSI